MYGILGLKDPQAAMTMLFLVLSISQIIHSFNQRSNIDSFFLQKIIINGCTSFRLEL